MMDTAGIRDTEDKVEQIGVNRAKECARDADLILYVADSSRELDESDRMIFDYISAGKTIILMNKTDLNEVITKEILQKELERHGISEVPILEISVKDHKGMEELEERISEMFLKGDISFNDEIYITNLRQKDALIRGCESLEKVLESIHMQMPEDFFTIDLMDAYEALGSITGDSIGEDLVNEIFSKFCMGK